MKPALKFKVDFTPTPWKRPAGSSHRYDSQVSEKNALGLLIAQHLRTALPAVTKEPHFSAHEPLAVSLCFAFKKPPSGKLHFPTNKSDVDNLAKFVLDTLQTGALSGRIWHDDGQVVSIHAEKFYSDSDFISCCIEHLEL